MHVSEADRDTVFVGAHVLVGITYERADGSIDERVQFHGEVTRIGDDAIDLRVAGSDEPFALPPDPDAFRPASPGNYRLRDPEEIVVDPDFTAIWTVELADH